MKSMQHKIQNIAVALLLAASAIPLAHTIPAQQSPPRQSPAPRQQADELERRAIAAQHARESANPAEIERANRLVVAEALRETAAIELAVGSPARAADLLRDSIAFEPNQSAQLELAYAEAQASHYQKAIDAALPIHAADPNNLRVNRILASSYTQLSQPDKAEPYFLAIVKAAPDVDNYYPLAVCELAIKTPQAHQRALDAFDQMKQIAGDSGPLHVLIGRAFRDGEDLPAAINEFRRALELNPKTPHAHYFIGLAMLSGNEWAATPDSEAEFRKEAELFPRDYLANYMLGFELSSERRYDEAAKYLEAAAKIDPTSPDPYVYQGMNAFTEDKWDAAEPLLRKAVELTGAEEDRANYQIRRVYVDLARIEGKKGNTDEARQFATKARELENKTMKDSQQRISAMVLNGGIGSAAAVVPLSKSEETAQLPTSKAQLDKMSPTQRRELDSRKAALVSVLALAYNDIATSLAIRGDYAAAEANYLQAETWDANFDGLEKNLGLSAFRAKDYPTAAKALALALHQTPNSAALRAMLGLSYFAMDQYAFASETFAPLGAAAMKDGDVGYAWAASLTHLGDMQKATEVLTTYLSQQRPTSALMVSGLLWIEIGDFDKAIATFDQALAIDSQLPKAHFNKGLAYIHAGRWTDAEKAFKAELDYRAGDAEAKYHLGFVYLQQSKIDQAMALFQDVIAAHPDHANAQYQVGKIFLDRDDFPHAAEHLEIAARLTPNKDYIHYQLQAAYRKLGRTAEADSQLAIYKEMKTKSREKATDLIKQIQQ